MPDSRAAPPSDRSTRRSGVPGAIADNIWPAWMTRDVGVLLAARASMSATRALAGVVVPIYLALIGFSAFELGLVFVAVALTSALMSTAIGLLADRIGRKPFIVAIPLLAGVSALAFIATRATAPIFIFAALGSFGRGAGAGAGTIGPYQPAEQALLAGTVPAKHRTSLFGRVGFASSLGAFIGAGPVIVLIQWLRSGGLSVQADLATYHLDFLFMAGFAVVAGLLALPVTEARPTPAPRPAATLAAGRTGPRRWLPRLSQPSWPILARLWVTNSVNGLAVGFFGPFITYWFFRRYGVGPALVGVLYSVINVAAMVSNLGAARISARLGLVRAIVISRALQAVLLIPMVLAPSFALAGAIYLVRMMCQRVGLPLRQSYVMGVFPPEERGTVAALSNLPSQATSAISPGLAGYLFDHVALALPFEIGAALQGLNTLLFFIFFRSLFPPEERAARRMHTGTITGQVASHPTWPSAQSLSTSPAPDAPDVTAATFPTDR